jgi:DNA-binding CsgD family transcriptional regulator
VTGTSVVERAERELRRLSQVGLDGQALALQAMQVLRSIVPLEAYFWAAADPSTLLFTGSVVSEIPERVTPLFLANEFLDSDVNKFERLARGRSRIATLYAATDGAPERSSRFRDILAPLGLGDELRVALMDGPGCWGFLCLHREAGGRPFSADELRLVQRLSGLLARGLRSTVLLEAARSSRTPGEPGLLILDSAYRVASLTPAAERWLAEIQDTPARQELPQVVTMLATKLLATLRDRTGASGDAPLPSTWTRARSGGWVHLHASPLVGPRAEQQIAVLLERARPNQTATLLLQAHGLTSREVEVSRLVLGGRSTRDIAQDLSITTLTVQQHLKAVFEKVNVRSRRELLARVFAEDYLPHLLAGTPRDSKGAFTGPLNG